MNTQNFIHDLEKLVEAQRPLTENTILDEEGIWDSLALVSTIALIDQHFSIKASGMQLASCKTLGDIIKLIHSFQEVNV